eukprot:COSAG02_NODE_26_length_51927_cov_61.213881_8_plen_740_part_00
MLHGRDIGSSPIIAVPRLKSLRPLCRAKRLRALIFQLEVWTLHHSTIFTLEYDIASRRRRGTREADERARGVATKLQEWCRGVGTIPIGRVYKWLMSAPSDISENLLDTGDEPDVGPRLYRQSVLVSNETAVSDAAAAREEEDNSADESFKHSSEPEFFYGHMIEQMVVHATFPLSLPYVLSRGGKTRCYNQLFLMDEVSSVALFAVVGLNWTPALVLWMVVYLDFAEGPAIGELESRLHPLFAIALVLNFARWAMIAAKYGYLTPAEYQRVLTNSNRSAQQTDIASIQLLTNWNSPTRAQLRRELAVSQERLGLCVEGLEFAVDSSGASRLAACLQETGSLKAPDDGSNLTCESRTTKSPNPDARRKVIGPSESDEPKYTVKAALLLLAVYEKAVSEERWDAYEFRANVGAIFCALLVFPAAAADSVLQSDGLATADHGGSNMTLTASAVLSAVSSQPAMYWAHRCLIAAILGFHLRVLWMWLFVALVDYRRKAHIMKRMGSLIAPALSIRSGVSVVDPILPLSSSDDVFAWLVCRRLLQNMGRTYQLRGQLLTGYVMFGLLAVFTVLTLNVFMSGTLKITPSVLQVLFGASDMVLCDVMGFMAITLLKPDYFVQTSTLLAFFPVGVSAVGLTLLVNFFGLAISIVKLIAAGAEVNRSAVLHQELLASCQLQMRYSHSQTVSPNGGGTVRSEAEMSAHDRMFDSAMRTLEICDLREPVTVLGMRASTSLLSPVRTQIT